MRLHIALLPLLGTILAQAHDHVLGPDDLLHDSELSPSTDKLKSPASAAERIVLPPLLLHSRPSLPTSTGSATTGSTSRHLANPNAGLGPRADYERRTQDCAPHLEMRPVRPPAYPRLHCLSQSTTTTTGEIAQTDRKRHASTSSRSVATSTPTTTTSAVVGVSGSGISHDNKDPKTDSESDGAWWTATAPSMTPSSHTARTHPRYLAKAPVEAKPRLELRRKVTIKLERAFEAFAASMRASRVALAPTSSKARRDKQAATGEMQMARERAKQANLDVLQAEAERLQSLYMMAAGSTSSEYFARPTFARPEPPRTRINSKR